MVSAFKILWDAQRFGACREQWWELTLCAGESLRLIPTLLNSTQGKHLRCSKALWESGPLSAVPATSTSPSRWLGHVASTRRWLWIVRDSWYWRAHVGIEQHWRMGSVHESIFGVIAWSTVIGRLFIGECLCFFGWMTCKLSCGPTRPFLSASANCFKLPKTWRCAMRFKYFFPF